MAGIKQKLTALTFSLTLLLTACSELPSPTAASVIISPASQTAPATTTTASLPTQTLPIAPQQITGTPVQVTSATDGPKLPELSPNSSLSGTPVDGIVEARSTKGTLWIKEPEFKYEGPNAGWPYYPLGDYKVYYRAPGTNTDQLLKIFPAIAEPSVSPCQTCERYNYLATFTPAADNHFLIEMRITTPNAQNGANIQYWWFEPETLTAKLLLTGPDGAGGGRFSTEALNTDWLFYNQWRSSTASTAPFASEDAHAFLINLATGIKKEVQLGDENVANHPTWRYVDKLYFAVRNTDGNLNDRVLDPQTGIVTAG